MISEKSIFCSCFAFQVGANWAERETSVELSCKEPSGNFEQWEKMEKGGSLKGMFFWQQQQPPKVNDVVDENLVWQDHPC